MAEDQTVEFVYRDRPAVLEYYEGPPRRYRCQIDSGPWDRFVSNSTLSHVEYSDPGGLMGYARNEALAGRDHKETTRLTQVRGNACHAQLEALAQTGKPLDLSDETEDVRGVLQGMAKWWLECSPKFIASEMIVCSPAHRCAGRFDFLAEVNGELILGDLKTSEKPFDHFRRYKGRAAYAQLALYAICYGEMFSDKPQPTGRYILHVNTEGEYDFERDRAPELSRASALSKIDTYRKDAGWDKADKTARKNEAAQLKLAA